MSEEDVKLRQAGREFAMKLPPGGRAVITMHVTAPDFKPSSNVVVLEESDLQPAEVLLTGWIPQYVAEFADGFALVEEGWQKTADKGMEVVWVKPDRPNPADQPA